MDWADSFFRSIFVVATIAGFLAFCTGIKSCMRETDEKMLECVKLGKAQAECTALFHR